MQTRVLILALIRLASSSSNITLPKQCEVNFKQDIYTHSRQLNRPLRIKLIIGQPSLPCTLSILLPTNHTIIFRIEADNIDPVILQDKVNVRRVSPEKLWLEVFSLEQESRSGIYIISGHTVFAIQTPSSKDDIPREVKNMTCMDLVMTRVVSQICSKPAMMVDRHA